MCRIAHARGDAQGQSGGSSQVVVVFVYIKLGTEVSEGGKRVEKKVKRKPTCRDDEIIFLIEGIGNEKSILMSKLQNSVTKNKKEVWREASSTLK